jgi:tetratricopeptide (TPR) repeat protein
VSDGPAWARLYFLQSYIFWQEGHYDEARSAGYEALKLFEEHLHKRPSSSGDSWSLTRLRRTLEGDPVDVARTHRLLGSLAYSTGQPTMALKHLNQALVLLEQHDHQREIAHVCCNMGHIHLQKAEHELAQNFLRRSLTLAERIGDIPLTAVVFSNLGELAARSGNLAEAESWYRRSLELAEQVDDHVYMSTWNVELAAVLQDQGRLAEAMACIYRALSIGRTINNAPCIGLALVALGNIRILQAREQAQPAGKSAMNYTPAGQRFLTRARATLQRALALQGLEAETKVKGQLALAHISLVEGKPAMAQQQAMQTLEEANRYESVRLLACTQRLLGNILATQGQSIEAEQHFQQAIQLFSKSGMRLEYARTLQSYGLTLLQANPQEALRNLHEAQQLYRECQATLDLQAIDHIL